MGHARGKKYFIFLPYFLLLSFHLVAFLRILFIYIIVMLNKEMDN